MEFIQSALSLIVTLGILVTIHEYGHFWVARRCGVKVLRFSVGFGKPLFSWYDKQGTEFAVAAIPLGGYVKMLDEREGSVPPEQLHMAFNNRPVGQRIAIAAAGPVANFLFAIVAYWLMFMIGFNVLVPKIGEVIADSPADQAGLVPGYEIVTVEGRDTPGWRAVSMELINRIGDSGNIRIEARPNDDRPAELFLLPVQSWLQNSEEKNLIGELGIKRYLPPVPAEMGQVLPDSPAEQGGLKPGDRVVMVGDQAINTWFDFVDVVKAAPEQRLNVTIERPNDNGGTDLIRLQLTPALHQGADGETYGRLGVGAAPFDYPPEMIRQVRHGPGQALLSAIDQTGADTMMTLNAIKKMLVGLLSLDNLSGPITIAQVASASISSGAEDFLSFLALLSISLGVLNLLPIPVLDGGHILYYSLEALRGKPLPEKWQVLGLKIGLCLILTLMTVAIYNDVMRL
ncbi:MAG: RIP metalloprotease RseP [Oleiphilaceae bacterium]|nr:RIP metalloprotease RseP [Oleiphilaceae bacterium]